MPLSEFFGTYLGLSVEDGNSPFDRADVTKQVAVEREGRCCCNTRYVPCLPAVDAGDLLVIYPERAMLSMHHS